MKLYYYLLLGICLNGSLSFGQIKFFKIFTDNGYDYGQGIVQLADSSYMLTGSSSSFGDAPSQVYLMKLNSLGEFQWSKNFGGVEGDWGRRVLNWNDSIFYVAGYSVSPVSGFFTNYLWKYDASGNQLLEKHYPHDGWDKVNDAIFTTDSTIYMVGETTATPNNNLNFYIVKTDQNGDTLWTRNFGSTGEDRISSIKQFNDTTFYAVGEIYNADSLLTKGVILKFHSNGTIYWTKQYGKHGNYGLNDFFIRGGNLYSIGKHVHPSFGDLDEYRLTTTMEGDFLEEFADHFTGNIFYEQVTKYGTDGKVYVVRNRQDGFSTAGSVDVAITRYYDNLVWNNLNVDVAFLQEDRNCQIISTSDGGAIATGYLTLDGLGGSSVYVIKIGPNDDFPIVNQDSVESIVSIPEITAVLNSDFSVYPNPSNGKITIKSEFIEPVHINIHSVLGQLVWSGDVLNGTEIETLQWKKGVYFVEYAAIDSATEMLKLFVH